LTTCWRCSRARGLTLIEVVAAIAILGTLLAGIVLAKSRHIDQRVRARVQMQAVDATDQMIARWWTDEERGVPIDASGALPGVEGVAWRTGVIDNAPIGELGARVVRVSVFDTADRPGVQRDVDEPMFVVDLVVRDPAVEARERAEAEAKQQAFDKRLEQGEER